MVLETFRRIFCNHNESYSFRMYDDFDFSEYNKCCRCGKILRCMKGFEEDIRG
jgi:hypothetical protein